MTVLLRVFFGAIIVLASGACPSCWAEDISFSHDIQPILSDNCFQCHGPDEEARQADLRLDRKEDLLAAVGDIPKDPSSAERERAIEESELYRRIATTDPDEVMPPPDTKRSLTDEQRGKIRDWIAAGAKWEGHWAFEKPSRPALPSLLTVTNSAANSVANSATAEDNPTTTSWPTNAIDHFVLAQSTAANLPHAAPASREKLLRRVTLDLTGLPPTIDELDDFLADESPDAYEKVVKRLLASPRFGERMAMDWLDAARYADTNGYQGDRERTMWPWRDWVIDAFNRNMPFDQFTVWQLAGDQIANPTDESKLATGFCRNHMINGEGGRIAEENRVEYVFDQIETLGTVWMGLTVQCCRCHDHKFDPMAQAEYFKLFAFFNQTPVNGGGGDPQQAPNMAVPDWKQQQQIDQLEKRVGDAKSQLTVVEKELGSCEEFSADVKSALDAKIAERKKEHWQKIEEQFAKTKPQFVSLTKSYREIKDKLDRTRRSVPKVMIMQDRSDKRRETFILNKGLYNQKQDKVEADTPAFLPLLSSRKDPNPAAAVYDRKDLAKWLTSPDHPLTARVTVNRLWQTFFGTGLVKTADDFGVQGEKPSHPKLLDWLATEFVDSGWDTKHLIQSIVTSSTYKQAATVTKQQLEQDPENRLLTRGPRKRMPAWMIRDHALVTSGLLTGSLAGPSVKTYQPAGIWAEASFGNKKYQQDKGEALYRRSLYIYWRRIVGPTVFFDMAKRQTCSVKAAQTNTPLHALVTLNDVTYVEAARMMATNLLTSAASDEERIAVAFRSATSRKARDSELELLLKRLRQLKTHYSADSSAASDLVQFGEMKLDDSIASGNEDDLAAYTTICLMILNLDEALNK